MEGEGEAGSDAEAQPPGNTLQRNWIHSAGLGGPGGGRTEEVTAASWREGLQRGLQPGGLGRARQAALGRLVGRSGGFLLQRRGLGLQKPGFFPWDMVG